jgi:hypothetical protein
MVRYRENDAVLGRCENISILEHGQEEAANGLVIEEEACEDHGHVNALGPELGLACFRCGKAVL